MEDFDINKLDLGLHNSDPADSVAAINALEESDEIYGTIFENAAEGLLVADVQTKRFVYVNPAVCKLLGYSQLELLSLKVFDLHPKESLPHVLSEFEAQAAGQKRLAANIPCLCKDGKVKYAHINCAPVIIDNRKCVVGFFTDITDLLEAQEKLTQAQAQYQAIIEQIPAVTYTSDCGTPMIKTYISPQIETVLGFSPIEFINDSTLWKQQVHPDDYQRLIDHIKHTCAEDMPFCCEYRMFTADERIVWLRDEAKIIKDEKGKLLFLQGVIFDITARRRTEEMLRQGKGELESSVRKRTAALEEANEKLKAQISSRAKIESQLLRYQDQLRNLASELSLAEERTRRQIATEVHDQIGQNLAMAKIKLDQLGTMVDDEHNNEIINSIKNLVTETIETTRSLTLEISPPVLYELGFEPAVEFLLTRVRKEHGIDTVFRTDGKEKIFDDNIRIFLFQAVRELLNNIIKHAKAERTEVSVNISQGHAVVSVCDNGVGIDREQLNAHHHTSSGFGLFSIRERLSCIGGKFKINSTPDKGTEINIAVPLSGEFS